MSFLAIPRYLWKHVFIAQEDEGQWVTIHGVHVFIREGETLDDAVNYLKVREFENNYDKNVKEFKDKKANMSPEEKQKYLDEHINKPLKEEYASAPKFFRGSSDNEILNYLRTGKFQAEREQDWKDGYTSLTLKPNTAYEFASELKKSNTVIEFDSYEVRGKSRPSTYLAKDYKDNMEKIGDGKWKMAQPSDWIDEAEIKARGLTPSPSSITVYTENPKDFYSSMINKYKEQFKREPPSAFMGRLNSIRIRPTSEFIKKYMGVPK